MNPQLTLSHQSRPGVIRAAAAVGSSSRSRNNEHVSLIVSLWWVITGDCDSMVCHHVQLSSSPFLSVVLAKIKPSHPSVRNQSVEDTELVMSVYVW